MLGDKVKELRKQNNITQQELAKAINLSQSTIGMMEKGKQGASRKTLLKLADFFGVTVDFLLSETEEQTDKNFNLSIKEQEKIDKEAQKILDEMSLAFSKNKETLSEEDYFAIENALKTTLETIKIKNKKKFTPKKYR